MGSSEYTEGRETSAAQQGGSGFADSNPGGWAGLHRMEEERSPLGGEHELRLRVGNKDCSRPVWLG